MGEGVAFFPNGGEAGFDFGQGGGGGGCDLDAGPEVEDAGSFGLGELGDESVADSGGVDEDPRADANVDAQADETGVDAVDVDDVGAIAHADAGGLAHLPDEGAEQGAGAILRVHAGDGVEGEDEDFEAEVVALGAGNFGQVVRVDEGAGEPVGGAEVEAGAGGDLAEGEFGMIAIEGFENAKALGEGEDLAFGIRTFGIR